MNAPKNDNKFVPKQAYAATPQLYDKIVGFGMENLAKASLSNETIHDGITIHDNGCGTGAGSAAIMSLIADKHKNISIKATDIDNNALAVYQARAEKENWPSKCINVDCHSLPFADNSIDLSLWNNLVFILPQESTLGLKETYRTLKPGGKIVVNSWAYIPNLEPMQVTAMTTRPPGTQLPRDGLDEWYNANKLEEVLIKGGFEKDKIVVEKVEVFTETVEIVQYATMLWSFVWGSTEAGWLKSDEERWDEAIAIFVRELRKTEGFEELEDGRARLRFMANVATATK